MPIAGTCAAALGPVERCLLHPTHPHKPHTHPTTTHRTTDPRPIDAWSDGGEAMGSLSFIGHLISIFLSLAVIVFLWYLIGACVCVCIGVGGRRVRARGLHVCRSKD